jgi:hypothetical protein
VGLEADETRRLLAVATDGFHRAASEGFLAELTLGISLGLLVEEGVTAVVVTLEVGGSGLAAQVAVDALVIDVIGSIDVLRILVGGVSHCLGLLR